ncbi:ANTAR domain-containing protein [Rhodococcus sp. HNM0569]|uniref:ANTAR domain-containing protein n=1 Tax=Rhodococcus sp. HNM0569 TaxID=2716340 RepID=UPI00146CCBA7|nr:ANTAR domain-containing protein [Rhodococcus sp. HNM0569]NLU84295.1 ANTAR domain-containing protein [Rhodococcus sp. HNM0569]
MTDQVHLDPARAPAASSEAPPHVVLDRSFRVLGITPEHERALGVPRSEILGRNAFDAFPANPDDPASDGADRVHEGFERVLRVKRPQHLWVQRYDVPNLATGGFERRVWNFTLRPVVETDGTISALVKEAEDITDIDTTFTRLAETAHTDDPATLQDQIHTLRALASSIPSYVQARTALAQENAHLRAALDTRAVIEQAKGILMVQRRCGADEAFDVLVKLSQDTNRKLRDVAAALVEHATAPER